MTFFDARRSIAAWTTSIRGSRWGGWWLVACVVVLWAVEISLVQHWTTMPDAVLPTGKIVENAGRRAILSLAACTAVVCLLRGWLLAAAFGAWAVAANVLVVFAAYFEAPLSWPVVSSQWREGLAVSDAGLALMNWTIVALAAAGCVLKLVMAWFIRRDDLPRKGLRVVVVTAACVYLGTAILVAGVHKPIKRIRSGTPEYVYGYVVAWVVECFCLDEKALLAEAMEKAAAKSDRLDTCGDSFEPGRHLVVVQVESLDFAAIEARVDGQPVMPYLHRLRDVAMLYSVKPFHEAGSSDADFSLLMAATPIGRFNAFQVAGFPYVDALPRLARSRGYRPVAFHGNTGSFFHRRKAYEQMGFDELYFTEELLPRNVAVKMDEELFAFSARLLAEAREPTMHFLITITSHAPFTGLPPEKQEVFPEPTTMEQRYLNSIRYVDRALERYVAALPDGTTVVLYGDHESRMREYATGLGHEDQVPWFIFEKGRDISPQQRSRETGLALSDSLTQLDMVCFLRERVAGSRPADQNPRRSRTVIAREPDANTLR